MCKFVTGDLEEHFSDRALLALANGHFLLMANASAYQYLSFRLSRVSEMQALLISDQLVWRFVGNREISAKRIDIDEGIC